MSNAPDYNKEFQEAVWDDCVINETPDLDMYKYLRGYEFSLDRMKKAK